MEAFVLLAALFLTPVFAAGVLLAFTEVDLVAFFVVFLPVVGLFITVVALAAVFFFAVVFPADLRAVLFFAAWLFLAALLFFAVVPFLREAAGLLAANFFVAPAVLRFLATGAPLVVLFPAAAVDVFFVVAFFFPAAPPELLLLPPAEVLFLGIVLSLLMKIHSISVFLLIW
ncbi:MAG: hypothetical protein JSV89_03070 [Spirochaetaceae bacterium]|nr:MAG: hypothetical protein JSV89_03070 [Spirochaetaceae bacterium]